MSTLIKRDKWLQWYITKTRASANLSGLQIKMAAMVVTGAVPIIDKHGFEIHVASQIMQ